MAVQQLEPITFDLAMPTQAHGEEITTLTLRPVTGEDVAACGYPFTIKNLRELESMGPDNTTTMPDLEFHPAAVIAMASRLAKVPRSTVAGLTGGDIWKLGFVLFRLFFPQIPAASSNVASISPGPGDSIPRPSLASVS